MSQCLHRSHLFLFVPAVTDSGVKSLSEAILWLSSLMRTRCVSSLRSCGDGRVEIASSRVEDLMGVVLGLGVGIA